MSHYLSQLFANNNCSCLPFMSCSCEEEVHEATLPLVRNPIPTQTMTQSKFEIYMNRTIECIRTTAKFMAHGTFTGNPIGRIAQFLIAFATGIQPCILSLYSALQFTNFLNCHSSDEALNEKTFNTFFMMTLFAYMVFFLPPMLYEQFRKGWEYIGYAAEGTYETDFSPKPQWLRIWSMIANIGTIPLVGWNFGQAIAKVQINFKGTLECLEDAFKNLNPNQVAISGLAAAIGTGLAAPQIRTYFNAAARPLYGVFGTAFAYTAYSTANTVMSLAVGMIKTGIKDIKEFSVTIGTTLIVFLCRLATYYDGNKQQVTLLDNPDDSKKVTYNGENLQGKLNAVSATKTASINLKKSTQRMVNNQGDAIENYMKAKREMSPWKKLAYLIVAIAGAGCIGYLTAANFESILKETYTREYAARGLGEEAANTLLDVIKYYIMAGLSAGRFYRFFYAFFGNPSIPEKELFEKIENNIAEIRKIEGITPATEV